MTSSGVSQSSIQGLIKFTGFYMVDSKIGSFVMIDTELVSTSGLATYKATLTVSWDGQTSQQVSLQDNYTFSSDTLVITPTLLGGISATLAFSQNPGFNSVSGTVSNGTAQSLQVSGTSQFMPIELNLWSGTYYAQGAEDNGVYPYAATLQVKGDGTTYYAADGASLTQVQDYSYDYAMFVIALILDSGKVTLFEMGTASGWGRVAGNAEHGQLLVSIKLQQQVKNL